MVFYEFFLLVFHGPPRRWWWIWFDWATRVGKKQNHNKSGLDILYLDLSLYYSENLHKIDFIVAITQYHRSLQSMDALNLCTRMKRARKIILNYVSTNSFPLSPYTWTNIICTKWKLVELDCRINTSFRAPIVIYPFQYILRPKNNVLFSINQFHNTWKPCVGGLIPHASPTYLQNQQGLAQTPQDCSHWPTHASNLLDTS